MARKWVKLWCSFDEDNLTLDEIGAWHVLLKLAGKGMLDGIVSIDDRLPYTHQQLSVYFNTTPYVVKQVLSKLVAKDRIEVLPNGFLKLKNWAKYQSEYDRIKEYPSKKGTAKGTEKGTAKGTPIEVEVDYRLKNIEVEVEKLPASAGVNIFKLFENCIGLVPSALVEELKDAETHYPSEYLTYAFKQAADYNKRSWKYVLGILARCEQEGIGNGHKPTQSDNLAEDPAEFARRYGHIRKESYVKS